MGGTDTAQQQSKSNRLIVGYVSSHSVLVERFCFIKYIHFTGEVAILQECVRVPRRERSLPAHYVQGLPPLCQSYLPHLSRASQQKLLAEILLMHCRTLQGRQHHAGEDMLFYYCSQESFSVKYVSFPRLCHMLLDILAPVLLPGSYSCFSTDRNALPSVMEHCSLWRLTCVCGLEICVLLWQLV